MKKGFFKKSVATLSRANRIVEKKKARGYIAIAIPSFGGRYMVFWKSKNEKI